MSKFSLVMPAGPGSQDTIKKAIDSILDQDHQDWELICIVNGEWEGKKKLIKLIEEFADKDDRISWDEAKVANACIARNIGAELSEGEYISFFSSDFYMYPGALRKWEKTFNEHSEADFIYSGYRLMKDGVIDHNIVIPSEPFDPYLLEVGNYIDGGFPMRRKVWEQGKWDPDIKSLNDWDFWLTAVKKNGFKGYYMPDFTYAAEAPKPGGLSYDSHANWLDRLNQIKKKHGIPKRDICVVSLGAQPHGKRIAKILNADFKVNPQDKPHEYKAIYLLGFYIGDGSSAVAHTQVFKNAEKSKKIIHWIGTDILQLIGAGHKVCYYDMKQLIDVLDKCENIAEFEQTQNELLLQGIESKVLALPIEQNIGIMPLPKKFKMAVYAPQTVTASQIYNLNFIKDIIKACPDIDFLLFGGGLMDFKRKNVENVGWCDMKKVMEKSSCLLRITYHDGLPVTPIEFRMAGRDAITSVQMPYIHYAGTGVIHEGNYGERKEKIIWLIREVIKKQKKGVKDIKKAREYYKKLTDPVEFKKKLLKIINAKST